MKLYLLLLSFMLLSTKGMGKFEPSEIFIDIKYQKAWETLSALETTYPSLLTIKKAEDVYGKKYPGKLFNDPKMMCGQQRCETPIVRLTAKDNITQATTKKSQVLLLGGFGGENTEGAAAIITYIAMLCRYYEKLPTLTYILKTRDLWFLPFPNSWGFYHTTDSELDLDPSHDFPYRVANGDCFKTKTARIINEVVSENLFQIAINFQYGSPAIAYSWSSYNHTQCGEFNQDLCNLNSPDIFSQGAIAEAMADAAGFVNSSNFSSPKPRYMDQRKRNTLKNNTVGAFEDWIYTASWDNASIPLTCHADNEYPSKLRSFSTSFSKSLQKISTSYDPDVSRYIRAFHKAVELAKPEIIHQKKPILTSNNPNYARLKTQLLAVGCLSIDYLVAVVREGEKCDGALHRIPIFTSSKKCRSISPWDNWNLDESQDWQPTDIDVIDVDITIPTKAYAACIYFDYSFDSRWNLKSHPNAALGPKSLLVLARSSTYLNVTTPNAKLVGQSHIDPDSQNKMEQGAIYNARYCHTNPESNVSVPDSVKAHTEAAKRQNFAPGIFSLNVKVVPVCVVSETDTDSVKPFRFPDSA